MRKRKGVVFFRCSGTAFVVYSFVIRGATQGCSWYDKLPHILYPCAALSHSWSISPLTLSRIRLPPITAWKCFTLSSCLMSTNIESPAASTVLCAVCTTGELWIEGSLMIVGTLSDATMNCAAYGLRPARRRNVSH